MSDLDNAMLKHIYYLVLVQHQPFSFKDFEYFEVDGKSYTMKHRTFNNKISKLKRHGVVVRLYKSHVSFYTLRGEELGNKTMTDNHTGVTTITRVTEFVNFIEDLPFDKKSIHDIHLKFKVQDIWKIVSHNKGYTIDSYSKDIRLQALITDDLKIQTTIHHTDTVSVVVGCSLYPVVLEDIHGIIRLSNALTRVEEKLLRVLDESRENFAGKYERILIPGNETWIITLWHFGRDTLVEYCGNGFSLTWEHGREALYRIYAKDLNGKTIIRSEKQENPNRKIGSVLKINSKDDIHILDFNQSKGL